MHRFTLHFLDAIWWWRLRVFSYTNFGFKIPTMSDAEENPSTTLFRDYIRINTMQPNPDYPACIKFLRGVADSMVLQCQVRILIETTNGQNKLVKLGTKDFDPGDKKSMKFVAFAYFMSNWNRWQNVLLTNPSWWWPGLDRTPPCPLLCSTPILTSFQVSPINMWIYLVK